MIPIIVFIAKGDCLIVMIISILTLKWADYVRQVCTNKMLHQITLIYDIPNVMHTGKPFLK